MSYTSLVEDYIKNIPIPSYADFLITSGDLNNHYTIILNGKIIKRDVPVLELIPYIFKRCHSDVNIFYSSMYWEEVHGGWKLSSHEDSI